MFQTIFSKLPSHFFLRFIQWDSNILAGTAKFHIGGVRECNFQNPSENPGYSVFMLSVRPNERTKVCP